MEVGAEKRCDNTSPQKKKNTELCGGFGMYVHAVAQWNNVRFLPETATYMYISKEKN